MTRRFLPAFFLILAANLCGCSKPGIKAGLTSPHGGTLVDLQENRGFAEILRQAATGQAGRSQVIVYFLDRDRNALMPAPTAVTFKGRVAGAQAVPFQPLDEADPSKAGGMASEPIADRGEIEGDLTATIGGSPVTIPILIR